MTRKSIAIILCFLFLFSAAVYAVEVETVTVSVMEKTNQAPVAQDVELNTYRGASVGGNFVAVDPEGDPLSFRLVTQPLKGSIRTDENSFVYTPDEGKRGKDVFLYEAIDAEGNVSETAEVTVRLLKQKTDISYPELENTMLEYHALRLAEAGIFVGEQVGGIYCFSPDAAVTRGEFLTMCAKLTNMEPLDSVTCTGFSDDAEITLWQKPYVSAALLYGVVQGSNQSGKVVFRADQTMSPAEAAVMLNNFMEISDSSVLTDQDVPYWAAQAVGNLTACDIHTSVDFTGDTPVTRQDAAQLLSAAMDVLDNRSSKSFSWTE